MIHEPPLPADVERRIAKYRATFDELADRNLSVETLDQLAWLGEIIASEDRQLPEAIRTEFALKGLEAGARSGAGRERSSEGEQATWQEAARRVLARPACNSHPNHREK
jgi:hypothetical protein